MIEFRHSGSFKSLENFFNTIKNQNVLEVLHRYGAEGVKRLAELTPVDTGKTSQSWSYDIVRTRNGYSIQWYNSNMANTVPVAILLQFGHATRSGTWVSGVDYINPALRDVFHNLSEELWMEVTR